MHSRQQRKKESQRLLIRHRNTPGSWDDVKIVNGCDWFALLRVFISAVFIFCFYNFVYKGRSLKAVTSNFTIPSVMPLPNTKDKILCLIGVETDDQTKLLHTIDTYLGPRCTLVFITDFDFTYRPVNGEIYKIPKNDLTYYDKRRYMTNYGFNFAFQKHLTKFQWFVRLPRPDVLFLPENFMTLIKSKKWRPNDKHYIGHVLEHEGDPFKLCVERLCAESS
eukprot:UN24230